MTICSAIPLTILKKYPQILEYYQDRYPYLCVDEAQDTSKLQHAVIGLLAQKKPESFPGGGRGPEHLPLSGGLPGKPAGISKTVSKSKAAEDGGKFFAAPGRLWSTPNRFISFNKQRYPKNMFTHNERGGPIEVKKLHDFSDQYHAAIEAYLAEAGTTAFIYRNNLSAVPIADILDRNDVDFYIKEHKARLKNNYVVSDVLAFFSLSFDSKDFAAFSRIFYKTSSCLKRNMLSRIPQGPLMEGESYFDRMVTLCDENQNTGKIRYISMMVEQLHKMDPVKAMECILYQIGYLGYLEFTSGAGYSMQAQKLNILMAPCLPGEHRRAVSGSNRRAGRDCSAARPAPAGAQLTLTTAHSAKGLEFDTVVLLDCMDDIFPAHSAVEKWKLGMEEEMEEEARLFYVACTRARKRLVLPYAEFFRQYTSGPFPLSVPPDGAGAEGGADQSGWHPAVSGADHRAQEFRLRPGGECQPRKGNLYRFLWQKRDPAP